MRVSHSNPANANNGAGGPGGILQEVTDQDISHLDPGLAYFVLDYQFTYATQRPLYSYLPNDQTTPVPDLAAGQPQISADNRTITVHIRPGVHYSPPVDREVTSADVAYAIERGLTRTSPTPTLASTTVTSSALTGRTGARSRVSRPQTPRPSSSA